MKRTLILAAMAVTVAACENVQDPTSVNAPQDLAPQMAVQTVTVSAKGKDTFQHIWGTFSQPATYNTAIRRLTFENDPVTGDARHIGYKKASGMSYGTGVITWPASNGVLWFVDLAFLNKPGNHIVRTATRIRACKVSAPTTCKQIKLYW